MPPAARLLAAAVLCAAIAADALASHGIWPAPVGLLTWPVRGLRPRGVSAYRFLGIRADFPDRQGSPIGQSEAASQASFADAFFGAQSWGDADVTDITVTPLLRLTRTAAELEATPYPFGVEELVVDAKAAAERAGYDLAAFEAFAVWHPSLSGWAAGTGAPFGAEIGGSGYPLLLAHELGHSLFGFPHAGVPGDSTGDHYDVMGYSPRIEPQTVNVAWKQRAGWLDAAHVHDVTATGTYRIQEHSNAARTATPLALRVRQNDLFDYWVELRHDLPGDPAVANGVVVHRAPTGAAGPADPGTELVAIPTLGQTFSDPVADVDVSPIAFTGTSPVTIDVFVRRGSGGLPPAPLTVTSPNGGNVWASGFPTVVTWRTAGSTGPLTIEMSANGGSSWTTLVAGTANDGVEAVTPPFTCTTCRVRVREADGSPSDTSDANFTTLALPGASLAVVSPNGGESWPAGSARTVAWTSSGAVGNVEIALSTDGGGSWTVLVPLTADDGSETITLPATPSASCRIRVRDRDGAPSDVSDGMFTITGGGSTTTTTSPPVTTTTGAGSTTTTTSMPPVTTTTTTLPPPDLCPAPAPVLAPRVLVGKLGGVQGDDTLRWTGSLDLPAGDPPVLQPLVTGAQVRIDDLGRGGLPILDLTAATTPLPGLGTCDPRDGWRGTTYRNRSGALPPACAPGTARGLSKLKLADRRAQGRGIGLSLKLKGAALEPVVGPLRATIVLDAAAGPCGSHAFVGCATRGGGSVLDCR